MKETHILIVGTDNKHIQDLGEALGKEGYFIDKASSAMEAQQKILDLVPDLIFIAPNLPDMQGMTYGAQLRQNSLTRHVPLILLSGFIPVPTLIEQAKNRLSAPTKVVIDETEEETIPNKHTPLHFISRVRDLLNHPKRAMEDADLHNDFLIGVMMVLLTPFVASFSKTITGAHTFDEWIGYFSVQIVSNLFMWVGIAGLLHMVLPFRGIACSMREALTMAGWGWAPSLIGALCSSAYSLTFQRLTGNTDPFSGGINLIPGLPNNDWVRFLSNFSLFDIWSASLIILAVWTMTEDEHHQWNTITVMVGAVCVVFGGLTPY